MTWVKHLLLLLIALLVMQQALAQSPTGANITFNQTEQKSAYAPEDYVNTSGGTFTTLILNATTQNTRWKAYAGNVTGTLTLDDAGDYTIYQWQETSFTGEVYTSRNNSIIWSNIGCANDTHVVTEEANLNFTSSQEDNINNTFQYHIHKSFYVGSTLIQNSTCKSTVTWVNDTSQSITEDALFQEVVLADGNSIVYASPLEQALQGFNFKNYDFQMIVPDRGVDGYTATRYYFWLELI